MANVTMHNGRKALDRWARETGHADFDTFLQLGGSMLACKTDLLYRREQIDQALLALGVLPLPAVGESALQQHEAEVTGTLTVHEDADIFPPAEPNAHVQGADS
jgi:hypothetical protein